MNKYRYYGVPAPENIKKRGIKPRFNTYRVVR